MIQNTIFIIIKKKCKTKIKSFHIEKNVCILFNCYSLLSFSLSLKQIFLPIEKHNCLIMLSSNAINMTLTNS